MAKRGRSGPQGFGRPRGSGQASGLIHGLRAGHTHSPLPLGSRLWSWPEGVVLGDLVHWPGRGLRGFQASGQETCGHSRGWEERGAEEVLKMERRGRGHLTFSEWRPCGFGKKYF